MWEGWVCTYLMYDLVALKSLLPFCFLLTMYCVTKSIMKKGEIASLNISGVMES